MITGPKIQAKECIYYQKDKRDTHASFDSKAKRYIIPVDGEYIIMKDSARIKTFLYHGSWIESPDLVANSFCECEFKK